MRTVVWVVFTAFFILAFLIHALFKYTRMISHIFMGLVYKGSSDVSVSSRGERITILDSRDREFEILFVENKGSDKVLVFCHESGSSKESWERYAYFVPDLGFHVLSVDFRNKGAETEEEALSQWPTEENVERLVTILRWAKKVISPHVRFALLGVSNGADIALAASFREHAVKGVVADGLFSMKEIFRDYIAKWAPILVKPNFFGERYPRWVVNLFTDLGFWYCQERSKKRFVDVEKLLKERHAPLLMIHGERDDYVPASHQVLLQRMNRDRRSAERLVIPEAGHNQAVVVGREIYEQKVTEFLTRVV
ncbi:MAG: alpha/beta hydrolase [Candidatus Omnitrophica bacterium]|nr:alpha/beta hydrolase [Candidatus Omnitrophota bacterium]